MVSFARLPEVQMFLNVYEGRIEEGEVEVEGAAPARKPYATFALKFNAFDEQRKTYTKHLTSLRLQCLMRLKDL